MVQNFIFTEQQKENKSTDIAHTTLVKVVYLSPVHTSNNVEATFDFVEAIFDFVASECE